MAKRHNVLITEDDPILVTVTLNELVLAEYLERVHARVQAAEDQISKKTSFTTSRASSRSPRRR